MGVFDWKAFIKKCLIMAFIHTFCLKLWAKSAVKAALEPNQILKEIQSSADDQKYSSF